MQIRGSVEARRVCACAEVREIEFHIERGVASLEMQIGANIVALGAYQYLLSTMVVVDAVS